MDVFNSLNTYKSDCTYNDGDHLNTPAPKSTKSFLIPDFFSTSSISTPAISPSTEKSLNCPNDGKNKGEHKHEQRLGFIFAPYDTDVRSFIKICQFFLSSYQFLYSSIDCIIFIFNDIRARSLKPP